MTFELHQFVYTRKFQPTATRTWCNWYLGSNSRGICSNRTQVGLYYDEHVERGGLLRTYARNHTFCFWSEAVPTNNLRAPVNTQYRLSINTHASHAQDRIVVIFTYLVPWPTVTRMPAGTVTTVTGYYTSKDFLYYIIIIIYADSFAVGGE